MKKFYNSATVIFIIFALFAGTLASCSDTAPRRGDSVEETDKAQLQSETLEEEDIAQSQSEPEEKIEGKWISTLKVSSGQEIRVEFEISRGENGALAALLNSPDQGAMGIRVDETTFEDSYLRMEIKSIQGLYVGKLKEDGSAIQGQWIQGGNSLPLDLKRAQ